MQLVRKVAEAVGKVVGPSVDGKPAVATTAGA